MLSPFECLCGNFILPEPASYVSFFALFNLRNLLYLINGHYRWDLNFAPNKKQAIIGAVEGRKGKASVEIKEYGEDDEHPHRTYDRSIQFSTDGTIAYFCLIAACAV